MIFSLQTMAQVTLVTEVEARELQRVHSSYSLTANLSSPTYTDIFVKVVADLLQDHRLINSTLEEDQIKMVEDTNIGVAVAAEKGLIVPVIRNANKKKLSEIALTSKDIIEKARQENLSIDEVMGGTFTITNLGAYGIDAFTPIVNPPQSAILGIGRMIERPAVADGEIVVKPSIVPSLTFDHEVMDGHVAATFLKSLKEKLESARLVEDLMGQESR